jgi:hypothetical protein
MSLSEEQKLRMVTLIKEKKEILFGKYTPKLTKQVKHKEWEAIYDQLIAIGAPLKDVHHLRKVL